MVFALVDVERVVSQDVVSRDQDLRLPSYLLQVSLLHYHRILREDAGSGHVLRVDR